MELTVLVVSACPGTAPLRERLNHVLEGRDDVAVRWHVVADAQEAESLGMHGSPTLLINGVDPLAPPGQQPSLSCRLGPLPSVPQLQVLLAEVTEQ